MTGTGTAFSGWAALHGPVLARALRWVEQRATARDGAVIDAAALAKGGRLTDGGAMAVLHELERAGLIAVDITSATGKRGRFNVAYRIPEGFRSPFNHRETPVLSTKHQRLESALPAR